MRDTADVLLGVIAASVAVMALIQVVAIVAGLRLAKRVERTIADLETSLRPLIDQATALSGEATRTARLAAAQVERFDRAVGDMTARVERTLGTVQDVVAGPARNSMALAAGIRAALNALYASRESTRRRSAVRSARFEEEEESLFIG